MFAKIFSFELKYRMIRPATYAYFGILFLFAFLTVINGGGPSSEKAYVNSPQGISLILIILSIFSMLLASAIMGVPIYRDKEHKTEQYFFAYPLSESSYLLGRFLGSFVVLILVNLGLHLGILLGSALGPFLGLEDASRFGPFNFMHYLYPTLIFTIPNLFLASTVFFALVALTKRIFTTYVGSIVLLIGWLLGNSLLQEIEYRNVLDIIDPFAFNTYINATRYWTPVEQNTLLVPLQGNLLINRILWMSVSLVIFALTVLRFDFARFLAKASGKKSKTVLEKLPNVSLPIPIATKVFTRGSLFKRMFQLAGLEFRNIIRDVYFFAILLGGLLFLFLDGWFGFSTYGTPSLPVTYYMLDVKDFEYLIFVFILITFYTGETVHRDKTSQFAQITDSLPIPNWVQYGSKFLALALMAFFLVNLVWVTGIANQILQGYFRFEFLTYLTDLYLIEFPEYLELVMLAFIVHILVNSKFLGHVVNIGIWLLMFGIRNFAEINYNLFFYSYTPNYLVSDMNGFGHFAEPLFWFHLYWLSLGAVFLVLGNLFWPRGTETSFKVRWNLMKQRFKGSTAVALTLFTLMFIGSGAYIYYNVSVLNTYRTAKETRRLQAEYEKTYKKLERANQPKIKDVKVFVDIYPEQRATKAKGKFVVVNRGEQAIDSLYLNISQQFSKVAIKEMTLDGKSLELVKNDKDLAFRIYTLSDPMQPGEERTLEMEIEARNEGFTNSGYNQSIVYNGTFFNLGLFPSFGYNAGRELTSDNERKKHDLPEKEYSLPPQDDPYGLSNLLFNDDAYYVSYEATVSTAPDQIAISPGYLQKTWEKDGRKYYYYKMEGEMDLFANFSSAEYAVEREKWKGPKGREVNIEIFHHPTHQYNLDRFIQSVKSSLDYYASNFSPYQYRQMRILEFPRYATFAQSFPNTVPYAESFGWIANFNNPDDTDYAFYVTAHEVAHQWWGHQITPSQTRGANQVSESMAEYSALMVLKHEYGEEAMQKFLKYSLDSYLSGRANESKFEETLLENDTRAYVWYRKGSLILYALQDYIGEARLNQAFSKFLKEAAFRQKPPFVTSNEWYGYIQEVTPDSLEYLLEDSFEKITLYENRVVNAEFEPLKNNKYKVKLTVDSQKKYYDKTGEEQAIGQKANLIDIGVFTEDTKTEQGLTKKVPLYLKKHWIKPGESTIEVVVEGKPIKAGIDPYNILIDRIPDDNVQTVKEVL